MTVCLVDSGFVTTVSRLQPTPMLPLYLVGGLIFVAVVIIFCIYYSQSMKMTSYLTGEVASAEERVVRDEHERREETLLVCTYSVAGEKYQLKHTVRGMRAKQFPPGTPITVWYNPTEPHMAKLKLR